MQLLAELLHDLEQEMLRLGYTQGSMKFYRRRWNMLLQFSKERDEVFYSEHLGMDFVEKHFHILEKDLSNTLSETDRNELRVMRMIGDFQLHHTVLRRYYNHKEIIKEPYFIVIRDKFRAFCEHRGCSKTTINYYIKQCERFMDYLISQNIPDFKSISIDLIHAYIKTLVGYAHATISDNISFIRYFLKFLLEISETQVDFSKSVPTIQCRQQPHIPSVWTKDELKKLIAAIDRGSPTGKRDYAIILLSCYLGLRCGDIKNLKMENFHWAEKQLIFSQSKTGTSLTLPLTKEVGWAVIDYLKHGRPKIDMGLQQNLWVHGGSTNPPI